MDGNRMTGHGVDGTPSVTLLLGDNINLIMIIVIACRAVSNSFVTDYNNLLKRLLIDIS